MTLRIGRRLRLASPTRRDSKRWPASSPLNRRIEVPELPHSSARAGAFRPCSPTPSMLTFAAARALDGYAHGAEDVHGGQRIGAFQEARHPGASLGERTQHDCPMRDRLVTRHPQLPLTCPPGNASSV